MLLLLPGGTAGGTMRRERGILGYIRLLRPEVAGLILIIRRRRRRRRSSLVFQVHECMSFRFALCCQISDVASIMFPLVLVDSVVAALVSGGVCLLRHLYWSLIAIPQTLF